MSDFDKEAEREKLRKKYADDADNRADTKRMSELLLKGATMTNQHCDTCGDPLFRDSGQTFCPTCQADSQQPAAQSDRTQQSTSGRSGDADQPQPPNGESTPTQPANNTPQPPNGESIPTQPANNTPQPTQPTPTTPATNGQPTQADTQSATNTSQSPATESSQSTATQPSQSTPQPPQSSPATAGDNGLRDARQSLAATVTRFSQRAAETDDPRRAKELLSAAREAAETLGALEFN